MRDMTSPSTSVAHQASSPTTAESCNDNEGTASMQWHDGPVELVTIDENGKCEINEYAADIIDRIEGKIAVVCIAGLYRTGKSYLLNRLIGLTEGFEIGPTVNPCTKGIWMWGQPMRMSENFYCIFLDTEGLGSFYRSKTVDNQLFSLAVLLSSYFIYNSMGAMNEKSIDDLALVLSITKHIQARSRNSQVGSPKGGSGESDMQDLAMYFPSFMWCLRDFSLQIVNDNNETLSPREYLEQALKPVPGKGKELDQKNDIRMAIRSLFRDRDCVTFPRPVANESDLRNIEKVPKESLRPAFLQQIDVFVKKVYSHIRPKMVHGAALNGGMFIGLLKQYVAAMNSSAVPTISTAWQSVVQTQLSKKLKNSLLAYKQVMNNRVMHSLPMEMSELLENHRIAKEAAESALNEIKFNSCDHYVQEARSELSSRIKKLIIHIQNENQVASNHRCDELIKELMNKMIMEKASHGGYTTISGVIQDFTKVVEIYDAKSSGPAKWQVRACRSVELLVGALGKVWQDVKANLENESMKHQKLLMDAEGKGIAVREMLDKERNSMNGSLANERRQWSKERAALENALEEMKRLVSDGQQQVSTLNAQFADERRVWQMEIESLHNRLNQQQSKKNTSAGVVTVKELTDLKDCVYHALSEMKSADLAKKHLELKSEHEKQLIGLERSFQKQLNDAKKKHEIQYEEMSKQYQIEIETLKSQRSQLQQQTKLVELELCSKKGNFEKIVEQLRTAQVEKRLQVDHCDLVYRYSDAIVDFLRRLAKGNVSQSTINQDLVGLANFGIPQKSTHFRAAPLPTGSSTFLSEQPSGSLINGFLSTNPETALTYAPSSTGPETALTYAPSSTGQDFMAWSPEVSEPPPLPSLGDPQPPPSNTSVPPSLNTFHNAAPSVPSLRKPGQMWMSYQTDSNKSYEGGDSNDSAQVQRRLTLQDMQQSSITTSDFFSQSASGGANKNKYTNHLVSADADLQSTNNFSTFTPSVASSAKSQSLEERETIERAPRLIGGIPQDDLSR
eukprot:GHVL01009127.1.p1 GENE.GHVL01009127.1~~GHVL01009127.1.p1  ORF type:complete len:1016 (-),score=183.50 GHVL01009127.1:3946-6993(-)